ncbi:hypothetical protein CLHUN_23380 [Ruminiclostridium hungatei]|uniref:LUD domain-containing protein n=1 Tax=Ruminiclostridium hungatei TaxID=48256 RepID=A0A1V4SK38_RUMHU|nr:lactate utilization protein [Ruminiclostridium hungatei]OPX43856.1 hypothetical protein CLHUN_23380 [Ruminiclostridium hungatei]
MDLNAKAILDKRIAKTMKNLERNNMQAHYVETRAAAVEKVKELLKDGDTVGVGGAQTLFECGIIDVLRSGNYKFLDRYAEGLTGGQLNQVFIESFSADSYICSANAITENGELYNVDGNSNRVAAICFGPKSVIIIAGRNKLVKNLEAAITRVKTFAAPSNAARLSCRTYCNEKGECMALSQNADEMASGCSSPERICCNYVVSAYQRHKDRIKVILVGEEIGY